MTFSVYLPPQAEKEKVPAVYWLSGLTCTDDNFPSCKFSCDPNDEVGR
jgi:S-formylglutathione hydrolase FrmB